MAVSAVRPDRQIQDRTARPRRWIAAVQAQCGEPRGNVFALDGVFATAILGLGAGGLPQASNAINTSHYNFAIPLNATITGIQVTAAVKASAAGFVSDLGVLIRKAGINVGTQHRNGNLWTTGVANQVYGSAMDLWGTTWTPADINDPGFGVAYSAGNYDQASGHTAYVDWLPITVFYTTPSGSGLPLGWTAGASNAGSGSAINGAFPVVFGDALSITGDGVTAERGQITQSATVDYLQNPVIVPGVSYGVQSKGCSGRRTDAGHDSRKPAIHYRSIHDGGTRRGRQPRQTAPYAAFQRRADFGTHRPNPCRPASASLRRRHAHQWRHICNRQHRNLSAR